MCALLKTFKTRPHWYIVALIISMLLFFTLFKRLVVNKKSNAPLPCYYFVKGDALPSAENPNFFPKERSIFFHETSCYGGLTIRAACSVEAAARAHQKRDIYVLFSAPVTYDQVNSGCLADLLKFPNIKFLRVHIAEYSKGTVVQSLLLDDFEQSIYKIHHTADVLRLLTLNKWGGVYLDTDMMVTRSLDDLPSNFVARQDPEELASGILSFAKDEIGRNVTNELLKQISTDYVPSYWALGADAMETVLQRYCPELLNSTDYLTKPVSTCKGVAIYNYQLFYPVYYSQVDDLFDSPTENFNLSRPYSYHMWNFLMFNTVIARGTVYDLLAQAFCPTIYNKYNYEFSSPE